MQELTQTMTLAEELDKAKRSKSSSRSRRKRIMIESIILWYMDVKDNLTEEQRQKFLKIVCK